MVPAREACPLADGEAGIVAAVIDGQTLRLDSGIEVRLAGIAAPEPPLSLPAGSTWPTAEAAKAELERLALGQAAILRYGDARRDRYGLALAQVFLLPEDGDALWLQQAMVEAGLARAYPSASDGGCSAELIDAERLARRSGLGLWSDPYYAIRAAVDPALAMRQDVYDLVEGRVVSVGRRGATVYLDFGRDWSTDFTAVLTREASDGLAAAGHPAETLEGRRVRLRGWIERRDGPSIRVTSPDQLELLNEGE